MRAKFRLIITNSGKMKETLTLKIGQIGRRLDAAVKCREIMFTPVDIFKPLTYFKSQKMILKKKSNLKRHESPPARE